MTAHLIAKLTQDCKREDCEIWANAYTIINNGGYSSVFNCSTCARRWSVFHPKNHKVTTYNKQGKATHPTPPEPLIKDIT